MNHELIRLGSRQRDNYGSYGGIRKKEKGRSPEEYKKDRAENFKKKKYVPRYKLSVTRSGDMLLEVS